MALISRNLLRPRPQQLGRIKIGGKGEKVRSRKGAEFRPPVKYDHFIVTTHVRGEDENFVRDGQIHDRIGKHPTELAAVLMFERPDENFHAEMVVYRGRGKDGKVWSCDGEDATNLKTGTVGPCVMAEGGKCECKPYSRLHLQLWASPYTMGYHVFRTTSWESTNNIQTALEEIYARFGTCYNAPVKLVLYPSEDAHENGVSVSYKVGLVLAMGMGEAAQHIGRARGYLDTAQGTVRALAAGVQEDLAERDDEEEQDIAEEYFPPRSEEIHRTLAADALDSPDPDGADLGTVESTEDPEAEDPEAEEPETDEQDDEPADQGEDRHQKPLPFS